MNTRITFENHRPISWNDFYSGKHYGQRKQEKDDIVQLMRAQLTGDEVPYPEPVDITFICEMTGNLTDADNVCPKYYIDALRHWHILHDDNPAHVASYRSIPLRAEKGSSPRLSILITTALARRLATAKLRKILEDAAPHQAFVSMSTADVHILLDLLGDRP